MNVVGAPAAQAQPADRRAAGRRWRRWACAPRTCAWRARRRRLRSVDVVEHLGCEALVHLRVESIELVRARRGASVPRTGERVQVALDPARLHCFDAGGARIELPAPHARALPLRDAGATAARARSSSSGTSYRADEQKALDAVRAPSGTARIADVQVEALALPNDGFRIEARGGDPARQRARPRSSSGTNARRVGARRARRAARDGRCAAGDFLDGTVAPLARRRQALRAAARVQEPGAVLPHAISSPSRPRPPTSWSRSPKRKAHNRRAVRARLRSGRVFYHAPWLHGFGGRFLDAAGNARARLADGAMRVASRSSQQLAAEELIAAESRPASSPTQLFNDGRAAHDHQRPVVRRRDRARACRSAVAPLPIGERDRQAGGAACSTSKRRCCPRARHARRPRSPSRAGSPATRRRGSARVDGRQTVAARAAWDDPEIAGDPILVGVPRAAGRRRCRCRTRRRCARSGSRRSRRCAGSCAARPSPKRALARGADRRSSTRSARRRRRRAASPYARLFGVVGSCWRCVGVASRTRARRPARRCARAVARPTPILLPAAVAMVVLVFVPFAVGAGMSLFHHERGPLDLRRPRQLRRHPGLARRAASPSRCRFYFTLAVTALWTVANVALHVSIGVSLALLLARSAAQAARRLPRAADRPVGGAQLHHRAHLEGHVPPPVRRHQRPARGAAASQPISLVLAASATAFAANVATNVWLGFPFMMVVTLGALSRIPQGARRGGRGRRRDAAGSGFRHVTLPLLTPGAAARR